MCGEAGRGSREAKVGAVSIAIDTTEDATRVGVPATRTGIPVLASRRMLIPVAVNRPTAVGRNGVKNTTSRAQCRD